ncbi:MAG: metallopeptidase family protein [Actinobacteria bacterium]|nr:metallopeptidase family protein [Actinomycetota bacterium]
MWRNALDILKRVPLQLDPQDFDVLVDQALARVPQELLAMVDNAVLLIEDDAPEDEPDLLGLYVGIPLTERDSHYAGVLPDRIYVFRNPTLAFCDTYEQAVDEVGVTVAHEIAHHFGISDERLHAWGWG